jgi:VanZ family protein
MSAVRSGFWFQVAPAFAYVVAVFIGGSLKLGPLPEGEAIGMDKLLHLVAFAGMQLVMLRALRFEKPELGTAFQAAIAAVLAIVAGGFLELWQAALPYRSAELLDWVADAIGATLAAVISVLVLRGAKAGTV